jgi:hypothetical protein
MQVYFVFVFVFVCHKYILFFVLLVLFSVCHSPVVVIHGHLTCRNCLPIPCHKSISYLYLYVRVVCWYCEFAKIFLPSLYLCMWCWHV